MEYRTGPGGVLPSKSDIDAAGDVTLGIFGRFTDVEDLGACVSHQQNLVKIDGMESLLQTLVQRGALASIEDGIVGEISWSVGLVGRDETNELLLRHGLQGVIQTPLISKGRDRIGRKLLPAEGAGAMGRINEHLIGKRQEPVVQRVVEMGAEVVGSPAKRSSQVGAAKVGDQQSVAGEDGVRCCVVLVE